MELLVLFLRLKTQLFNVNGTFPHFVLLYTQSINEIDSTSGTTFVLFSTVYGTVPHLEIFVLSMFTVHLWCIDFKCLKIVSFILCQLFLSRWIILFYSFSPWWRHHLTWALTRCLSLCLWSTPYGLPSPWFPLSSRGSSRYFSVPKVLLKISMWIKLHQNQKYIKVVSRNINVN